MAVFDPNGMSFPFYARSGLDLVKEIYDKLYLIDGQIKTFGTSIETLQKMISEQDNRIKKLESDVAAMRDWEHMMYKQMLPIYESYREHQQFAPLTIEEHMDAVEIKLNEERRADLARKKGEII